MARTHDPQTTKCPRCGESVYRRAIRCPHCGSSLFLDNEVRTRIIEQRHFASKRPGLGFYVVILALLAAIAGLVWMYLRHH